MKVNKSVHWLVLIMAAVGLIGFPTVGVSAPKSLVSFGGSPGTASYAHMIAIAKILKEHSPIEKLDVLPLGSAAGWPMFQSREVDVGLIGPVDAIAAYQGKFVYEKSSGGKGYPIRTLFHTSLFPLGFVVPGDSPAKTISDLKGKRIPTDYGMYFATSQTANALLANAGLTVDDVVGLKVTSFSEGVKAVIEGRADAAGVGWASGIIQELKAARGARMLGIDPSEEAMERSRKVFPGYTAVKFPAGYYPSVQQEQYGLTYINALWCRPDLSEEVVYQFVKAVFENLEELRPMHAGFKDWDTKYFASTTAVIPYHEGSIKLFKEKGVWTKELEALQRKLLKQKGGGK